MTEDQFARQLEERLAPIRRRWLALNVLAIIVAVGFAAARIYGIEDKVFKAFAHVAVGWYGGAACFAGLRLYTLLFCGLCVVEILCFLHSRHVF